jgi:hypothetical protein
VRESGQRQTCNKAGIAHRKALRLLRRHAPKAGRGIVPFPAARQVLSWLFHLDKEESRLFLQEMEEFGLLRVHPYRGVRLADQGERTARGDEGDCHAATVL